MTIRDYVAGLVVVAVCAGGAWARAADGSLNVRTEGGEVKLRVSGSSKDDWKFERSTDLVNWSAASELGVVLSGGVEAPERTAPLESGGGLFYRAVQTEGLYDPTLFRTVSLTFTQANWSTLLANARTTGSNVLCSVLTLDNGSTQYNVGARYKGNSSYTMGGAKKSVNLEMDFRDPDARLMGFSTVNLNNAAGDETIMREALYFTVMARYTISPKASMSRLMINGADWGVYSLVQQENGELIKEWFSNNNGDRWQAPNVGGGVGTPGAPGGPGGPGGGGGFSSAASALSYLGPNVSSYRANYELKTDNSTNAWERLVHVIDVLNNTPAATFRDTVEEVMAVDRWLWFLAIENIFADDDSYFNKGADYGFYYEPETGRVHPVEHDGNEAFTTADASLSPVEGSTGTNRPVLLKFLGNPELRQRYLAHMRTVLAESFHPDVMNGWINRFAALSVPAIMADSRKGYTMTTYSNDLASLRSFVATRHRFLTNHTELRPLQPVIARASGPVKAPTPSETPFVTADVQAAPGEGIDSVWLYFRVKSYGRFQRQQMFDDGAHGDGVAGDGVYGGGTTNYPAGAKVRFYVEARSSNAAKAAAFLPTHAEESTFSYRVGLVTAPTTSVIISEFMAANLSTVADPQGDFDDWIELHNISTSPVDLTGLYLTDDPASPRKWPFPAGTVIPADGYLIVWADENGGASRGLHASFKLNASGEAIYLIDADARQNAVLDSIMFGPQTPDRSYGRSAANADLWLILDPTPGRANP